MDRFIIAKNCEKVNSYRVFSAKQGRKFFPFHLEPDEHTFLLGFILLQHTEGLAREILANVRCIIFDEVVAKFKYVHSFPSVFRQKYVK